MKVGEKGYMIRKGGTCYGKNDRRNKGPYISFDCASAAARRLGGEVVQVELRVVGVMKAVPDEADAFVRAAVMNQG